MSTGIDIWSPESGGCLRSVCNETQSGMDYISDWEMQMERFSEGKDWRVKETYDQNRKNGERVGERN